MKIRVSARLIIEIRASWNSMNETQFVEGWQAKHNGLSLSLSLCVNDRLNRVNDDQLELFHLQYNRFKFE